jgi:uncharacterized RDD family membrane protein YckC
MVFTVAVTEPVAGPLVSGEGVELDVRTAGVGSRVLALMLDILVQLVLYLVLGVIVLLVVFYGFPALADDALIEGSRIVLAVVVLAGYPIMMETFASGRTLGKFALGLRVVRDDGGPIQFRHALTRTLVGVALEWPGLILPLLAWAVSLTSMLSHPRGKRLGDLAAGTIVIHERTPATWGWVPAMPPPLARWAALLDLTGLDDELALAVRHFLARNRQLSEPGRTRLGYALAAEVAACTTPPPPPGVPGWQYLAAVLAERHRRAAHRLAVARGATAQVWPDLVAATAATSATSAPPAGPPAGPPR